MSTRRKNNESKPKLSKSTLSIIFIIIVGLGIASIFLLQKPLSLSDSADMGLGSVNCSVDLETVAYHNGEPVTIPLSNSPLYVSGQQIDQIDVSLNVQASGNYVDWTTLSLDIIIYVNGLQTETWLWGTGLSSSATGFTNTDSYSITDLSMLTLGTPSEKWDNGVEVYDLNVKAEVAGKITDTKGNLVEDTLVIQNEWNLQTDPDGSFYLDGERVFKPGFTSIPADSSMKVGEDNILTWKAADNNPTTYEIKAYTVADGSTIQKSGSWSNTTAMTWNAGSFSSLEPGDYTLIVTCTIHDEDGHTVQDSVQISVTVPAPSTAPTFGDSSGPTLVTNTPFEVVITFTPSASYPSSYKVYLNSVEIQSGDWTGGDITVIISSSDSETLVAGDNQIKCVVYDTASQSASDIHYVSLSLSYNTGEPTDPIAANPFFSVTGALSLGGLVFVIMYIVWERRR